MSTRGNISVRVPEELIGKTYKNIHGQDIKINGKYATIYNHHDSYIDGLGQILLDYYKDLPSVLGLVMGGDTSSVGEVPEWCDYYASSEGWYDGIAPKFTDVSPARQEEYLYIFESGKWSVYDGGYNYNGPLENYINPSETEAVEEKETVTLSKNFCYYLHGYLCGLRQTQRENTALDSIIKTLEDELGV